MLAGVRAHNADMELGPLVRIMLGDRELVLFYKEVSNDGEYAAGTCDLRGIVRKAPPYDESSS